MFLKKIKRIARRVLYFVDYKAVVSFLLVCFFLFSNIANVLISKTKSNDSIPVAPQAQAATYQFFPTASTVETGTEQTVTSQTAAAAEGTNVGSYQGILANDSFHWSVASTTSGISMITTFGGVALNGANKLDVLAEYDLDATIPALVVQICDTVSSTGVDNSADANCATGGWRTINTQNISNADITTTATTTLQLRWQIYNGYFYSGTTNGGTWIDTPLSNFIDGSNNLKIRLYSTTNTTSVVSVDYLSVFAYIDSIYAPQTVVDQTSGGGTLNGIVPNMQYMVNTATAFSMVGANDNNRFSVAVASSNTPDFYLAFKGIKQYTGMNTILSGFSVSCNSATTIRPYLYNFTSSSWTAIGSNISCTTTDVDYRIAQNSTADAGFVFGDYVSSGEVRLRFVTTAAVSSNGIKLDWAYIMLGSVNTDSSLCEISFGTGTATNCTNTRGMDTNSGSPSTFDIAGEDESTTMGTGESNSFYANDNDADAVVEEAVAANISFPVTVPANAQVVGINWASRTTSRSAGTTQVINSVRDYSGFTSTAGGWSDVGSAVSATTQTYQDTTTAGAVLLWGLQINPEDYVDTVNGRMNMRLRTSTSGATTDNSTTAWDFAMMSIQWIEDSYNPTVRYQFTPTGETLVTGTDGQITSATATAAEGVNLGSWKALLADDNFHWVITGATTGVDMEVNLDGVKLNNANTLIVQTEIDTDATSPATVVQICDWVSSTGVDNAADSNCTTGGWRTLNSRKATVAPTTSTAYTWYVYDGKWSNGSNTARSTPLTNFVTTDSNKRVLIRYYSTTNATTANNFAVDYLRVFPVVNPVYEPVGATALTNSLTNDYTNVNTVTQGGSDNTDLQCLGTTGGPDCYLSFKNIKTYPSMNTILVRSEWSCSTATAIKMAIYNFSSASWEDLINEIASCSATDTVRIGAKNNISINDYLSSSGEVRVRYYRSSGAGTGRIDIDYAYIMLGTTNSDSGASYCFISFGSNSANDCTATRDINMNGTTNNGTTWQILAEDESTSRGTGSAADYFAFDIDGDATASEEGSASHTKFSLSGEPTYGSITGLFFASQHMAGTGGTVALNTADYSGYNTAAATIGSFITLGATATTALVYTDNITVATNTSGGMAGYMTNPEDLVNTSGDEGWFRLRTSTDGSSATNAVRQWDFAMLSLQWVEPEDRTISFDISDTTIGFGPLSSSGARYATGDGAGSDTEVEAHTITASASSARGYTIFVDGPTLTSGSDTITHIGNSNTASSPGTEQFGIRTEVSGISDFDEIDNTYSGSGFGYNGTGSPSRFVRQTEGDGLASTYSVRYIANISPATESGSYSTDLTYIMTGNF